MAGPGPPAPSPPSSGPRSSESLGETTSACCRCDDYAIEITAQAGSRYYRRPSANGGPFDPKVRYHLDVRLKSAQETLVTVRLRLLPDPSVSAAAATDAKTRMNQAVMVLWNPAVRMILVEDPKCPSMHLVVNYDVQWVRAGEHFVLALHEHWARDYVAGYVLDARADTTAETYAHEFGHLVGLPDEYSYTTAPQQVIYNRPDGTQDPPINATPLVPANSPGATLMSSQGNHRILSRHSYNIAIEVQDLLTARLGRKIRCTSV